MALAVRRAPVVCALATSLAPQAVLRTGGAARLRAPVSVRGGCGAAPRPHEVAAALSAKQRAPGEITPQQRERALSRVLQDCNEHFLLLPVDRLVIDRAVMLTQHHWLRGDDAVQLATALVTSETLQSQNLSPTIFVANDDDLLTAAAAENLPNR